MARSGEESDVIAHLMYMDDVKIYGASQGQLRLLGITGEVSLDLGM